MQQILLIVVLIVGVLVAVWWFTRKPKPVSTKRTSNRGVEALDTLMAWHPTPTRVLTAAERQAYNVLHRALPEHMILAQVPLARFLKVPTRHSYAEWLRRAGQLCADLVVCDQSSQVVAVVEVRSTDAQESDRTRKRQARMDRVLEASGIPLHVWSETRLPTPAAARDALLAQPVVVNSEEGGATVSTRKPVPTLHAESALGQGADANGVNGEDLGERQDPPSSTWFDDFDSAPMPLSTPPSTTSRQR